VEETNPVPGVGSGAPTEENSQERFGIHKIYVKDISLETPNSPQIFAEQEWQPQVDMDMSTQIQTLNGGNYEVVIKVTATVKVGDKTAFLIEVHQAGLFALINFEGNRLAYMLESYCPTILFPYIREAISDIVIRGGFQPMLLAPVNFDAVFAEKMKKIQQQQQEANQETPTA